MICQIIRPARLAAMLPVKSRNVLEFMKTKVNKRVLLLQARKKL